MHLKWQSRSLPCPNRPAFSLQEVGRRSERITALEREKASLIRELFNARSEPRRPHPDETTLI